MKSASIKYVPEGTARFRCCVQTGRGATATFSGTIDAVDPETSGDRRLLLNAALVNNAWAYAKHEHAYRRSRSAELREVNRKQADEHAATATGIADLIDALGSEHRQAWCSGCFARTAHRRVSGRRYAPPAYLCIGCGSPTTPCASPNCGNMATRRTQSVCVPRYCAEHRHEIPGFTKMNRQLDSIDDYKEWLDHDKANLARYTRVGLASVGAGTVLAPVAFFSAPLIGGIIGASAMGGGLTGAAATSHGLAMLGLGSLASGGLGMAGGTAVVTAAGATLGSAYGAAVTTAYVGNDKSFRIQKLRDGAGPAVLLASGFLTQGDKGWGQWRRLVDSRYPDAPVYRVHWGSKELKNLGSFVTKGAVKTATLRRAALVAARSSRAASKAVPVLGPSLLVPDLARNPWTVAKNRSEMTGAILADIIQRTRTPEYVLVGHSLGARVMVTAAQALGTTHGTPRLGVVHLLGAAVTSGGDWMSLDSAVRDTVWNYWSSNDRVLNYTFRTVQLGRQAVGAKGFRSSHPKIRDRNVSRLVSSHSDYFTAVHLE